MNGKVQELDCKRTKKKSNDYSKLTRMQVKVREFHGVKKELAYGEDAGQQQQQQQEEEDLQTKLLQQTGCKILNDKVLECFYDRKDWRACQEEVAQFRQCYEEYQRSRQAASHPAKNDK